MEDLRGLRFGKGIVPLIGDPMRATNGGTKWLFLCDCDRTPAFYAWSEVLKRSPGMCCKLCRNEIVRAAMTTHGMRFTTFYRVWRNMLDRCENSNHEAYPCYGGRNISVCERWHTFENFRDDMLATYSQELTIERLNNNGNYEPGNCEWRGRKHQASNRRTNKFLTHNGQTHTYSGWAEIIGLDKTTIRKRVLRGWPVWKILSRERF